jgi:hypothetical protein
MKKIVLIGDSIRMGYCEYVKNAFSDVAEVYYPPENCRYAVNVLRFAGEWKSKGNWPSDIDMVHFNAGLWDVLRIHDGEMLSTYEYYKYTIERVGKTMRRLFPTAKLVFATSTAIVETPNKKRFNKDIEEFNAAAIEVLSPLGIEINDLYAITKDIAPECRSDETHFNNDLGRATVGGAVVNYISSALGIKSNTANTSKEIAKASNEKALVSDNDIGF